MTRKLATIRTICGIKPIVGADAICAYQVDGWWVVDQINKYQIGDLVIYCEIDSWLPHDLAPFLSKGREPREFNGIKGERLRTIKLKDQISQGLLLNLEKEFTKHFNVHLHLSDGDDLTPYLNIQLWERPITAYWKTIAKGNFPSFIKKTDQERVQNLRRDLEKWGEQYLTWEVTEKLDGSSMTVYVNNDKSGVCSRNLALIESDDNNFWHVAKRLDLINRLKSLGRNIALQGELVGPGIQGNIYGLLQLEFYVFDIFDIDTHEYILPEDRYELIRRLNKHINDNMRINLVPVFPDRVIVDSTIDDLLNQAEGVSALNNSIEREGIVFKSFTTQDSFKAISNKFLLGEK